MEQLKLVLMTALSILMLLFLEKIFLLSFNTNKTIDMSEMFKNCSKLTNIDISSFIINDNNKMEKMFDGLKNIKNIDIHENSKKKFDTQFPELSTKIIPKVNDNKIRI